MLDLKNCPFCGNDGSGPIEDALHIHHNEPAEWNEGHTWTVQCDKCTATMGYFDSEDDAIAAWNRRALQAVGPEPVAWQYRWQSETGEWSGWIATDLDPNDWVWPHYWKDIESRPLYSALVATPPAAPSGCAFDNDHLAWACERWQREVANRPLRNVHRRSLDDTWRQVIRRLGGDPAALLSMADHDTLVAKNPDAAVRTPPAEPVVETDWINYRPLAEGEVIQAGDECLTDSHLGWQPAANTVGGVAPDPLYTAHRLYRRPLATKPAVKDDELVVEAQERALDVARGLEACDWQNVPIGNKAIIQHAIKLLTAFAAKDGRS